MINKAFEAVNNKVFSVLEKAGYTKQRVVNSDSNELAALYTGEATAYNIVYYKDKQHMVLRSCDMTDEGPDNEWKTISTWMFDPNADTLKEAENIGNDFADTVDTAKKANAVKQQKKRKKSEEGGDPIFFFKRLVNVFPELKDEIKYEEMNYDSFRSVTFAKEHVVGRINDLLARREKGYCKKLGEVLSQQYIYGDLDVRSIITIIILNNVDEKNEEILKQYLSDDLNKSWVNAKKFKGKKVKPEKPKAKSRSYMADTLKK